MGAGAVRLSGPARGLAVDGERPQLLARCRRGPGRVQRGEPGVQHRVGDVGVHGEQDPADRGQARRRAGHAQAWPAPAGTVGGPVRHRGQRPGTAQHGAQRHHQDGGQLVATASPAPRVGDRRQHMPHRHRNTRVSPRHSLTQGSQSRVESRDEERYGCGHGRPPDRSGWTSTPTTIPAPAVPAHYISTGVSPRRHAAVATLNRPCPRGGEACRLARSRDPLRSRSGDPTPSPRAGRCWAARNGVGRGERPGWPVCPAVGSTGVVRIASQIATDGRSRRSEPTDRGHVPGGRRVCADAGRCQRRPSGQQPSLPGTRGRTRAAASQQGDRRPTTGRSHRAVTPPS